MQIFVWTGETYWIFAFSLLMNFTAWIGYITMYLEDLRDPPKFAGRRALKHAPRK